MFNDVGNIGELLRKVGKAVFIIGVILAILVIINGIILASEFGSGGIFLIYLLYGAFICFGSYVSGLALYGFGKIVTKHEE